MLPFPTPAFPFLPTFLPSCFDPYGQESASLTYGKQIRLDGDSFSLLVDGRPLAVAHFNNKGSNGLYRAVVTRLGELLLLLQQAAVQGAQREQAESFWIYMETYKIFRNLSK